MIALFFTNFGFAQEQEAPFTLADRDRLIRLEVNLNVLTGRVNTLDKTINSRIDDLDNRLKARMDRLGNTNSTLISPGGSGWCWRRFLSYSDVLFGIGEQR